MDPFEALKFCPQCGKSNWENRTSRLRVCKDCGYEMYKNPTIGAAALIFDEQNRLMLLRRAKNPGLGKLDVPGGFCEVSEKIENAVKREVKEETNIDVEIERFLFSIPNNYEYMGVQLYPLDFFFKCKIIDDSKFELDLSENSEMMFLSPEEIKPEDIALPSIRLALQWLKEGNLKVL